jgi:YD repeat-containing protein
VEWAVWHTAGTVVSFQKQGSSFVAPESGLILTFGGSATTTYPCSGMVPDPSYTAPYGWFTVKTADGTQYFFNQAQPGTGTHLYWSKGHCNAVPYYLLSRIQDRWGRYANLKWTNVTVGSGTEPRVTGVTDDAGKTLTLQYPNGDGLLRSVIDPYGRTHTLTYAGVDDENSVSRLKLTAISVKGPGSPTSTVHNWSFV